MEEMLKYHIRRTEKDFADLNKKMDHVTKRVDNLFGFKMKMIGIFAGVSGLVSIVVTLITLYLKAV